MKKSVIRQSFFEKQQRKHVWLGILCSVCMVLSLVLAIPVTALAGEGEKEITSVTIVGVDTDLDTGKNFKLGSLASDSEDKCSILDQGWTDGALSKCNVKNDKPESNNSYAYWVELEPKSEFCFPKTESGEYKGTVYISGASVTCNVYFSYENPKVLYIQTEYISPNISDNSTGETPSGGSGTEGGDAGTGGPSGNNSSNSNNSSTSNSTSHTHSFAWCTIKEPTDGQDGLEAYACTSCGYYEESVPVSAYSYACNGGAKQVISAAQGSELTLDMGVWCAYPKWFMQKIADRRDLTIRLLFEYEHKQYEVIIPAGAAVDTQCDWYGPLKLCSLYAYTVK